MELDIDVITFNLGRIQRASELANIAITCGDGKVFLEHMWTIAEATSLILMHHHMGYMSSKRSDSIRPTGKGALTR